MPSYIGKRPKKKEKKKTMEEKVLEGVGYWSKLCESQGDYSEKKKGEDESSATSSSGPPRGTADLPSKHEVDRQQAEMETWADRWYANKKVQSVVKSSKMMSKVRTQIKLKEFKLAGGKKPDAAATATDDLPKVFGSTSDYDAIAPTGASSSTSKAPAASASAATAADSDSSDDGGEDDLWGDIMGKS